MTASEIADLRGLFESEGQGHVFAHWDALDESGRERLSRQLESIDFELLGERRGLLAPTAADAPLPRCEPPELFPLERDADATRQAAEAIQRGEDALSAGLVGCVLVAGGQGSRLGFEGPKGMFPVGPVSGCSLFEWHARRLLAARDRYGTAPTWYIMTSDTNDAPTRAFFAENDHFGLGADNVRFFTQAMLPALDTIGRILMSAKGALFLAPNGHGGTLAALAASGSLEHARERGIECFCYLQVDNPLGRPADPLFIGLHLIEGAMMSNKTIAKRDAEEKVGVIGRVDGKLGCIEYSDLPDELRNARDASGALLFRAGNTASHMLDRRFIEELTKDGLRLPWHVARKRMRVVDESGATIEVDGVKFETFVFDALGYAERTVTLEVDRALEFSPVKNAEGADSPLSTRRALTGMFAGWIEAAGGEPPPTDEHGHPLVEVDPRFAEDHASFRARMPARPELRGSGHMYR